MTDAMSGSYTLPQGGGMQVRFFPPKVPFLFFIKFKVRTLCFMLPHSPVLAFLSAFPFLLLSSRSASPHFLPHEASGLFAGLCYFCQLFPAETVPPTTSAHDRPPRVRLDRTDRLGARLFGIASDQMAGEFVRLQGE